MHLRDWLSTQGKGARIRLIRATGVSANIIYARTWKPITSYHTAKRIVEYTNGEVTFEDLCEPLKDKGAA